MLGDLDDLEAGGVVSTDVVVAGCRGIVISKYWALLQEYGGHISKTSEVYMNLVKEKFSPSDCENVKVYFLERI